MPRTADLLSITLPPRGLSRVAAAAYIGVGATLFDKMVREGLMPKPVRIFRRTVWDRLALDAAFSALPHDDEGVEEAADDEWSKVA